MPAQGGALHPHRKLAHTREGGELAELGRRHGDILSEERVNLVEKCCDGGLVETDIVDG